MITKTLTSLARGSLLGAIVGGALALIGGLIFALLFELAEGRFDAGQLLEVGLVCGLLGLAVGVPAGAVRDSIQTSRRQRGLSTRRFDRYAAFGLLLGAGTGGLLGLVVSVAAWPNSLLQLPRVLLFVGMLSVPGGLLGLVAGALRGAWEPRRVPAKAPEWEAAPGLSRVDLVLCALYASVLAWVPLGFGLALDIGHLAEELMFTLSPLPLSRGYVGAMLAGSFVLATFLGLAGRASRTPPRLRVPDHHKLLVCLAGVVGGLTWGPFALVVLL